MARAETLRGTRRSTMMRRGEGLQFNVLLWVRRFGIACLCFVGLLVLGVVFLLNDGNNYFHKRITQKIMEVTSGMGYRVENILVEGRVNTDSKAVLDLIGVSKGDAVFKVDPEEIRDELEAISWIKSAHVERRLPDTVFVKLEERAPFALWQQKDKLVLIDREGVVLSDKNLKKYKNLIMVSGEGAAGQVLDLTRMIAAEPEIKSRLDHAIRIDGRRWDLVLKDGKVIKLPEKDIGYAMRNLMVRHQKEGLLDKALTSIDVRDPERLIVRTQIGKAQDLMGLDTQQGRNL